MKSSFAVNAALCVLPAISGHFHIRVSGESVRGSFTHTAEHAVADNPWVTL